MGGPLYKPAKGGWVLFQVVLHLTTKEHPCLVYSNSMTSNSIIGQTIMYNGTTSGFGFKSWWHTTLWTAAMSIYAKMPCSNLWWSITQSFLPQTCISLEAVLPKLHAKLTPGWPLIQANFDPIQEIRPKVGVGHSFEGGCSWEHYIYHLFLAFHI